MTMDPVVYENGGAAPYPQTCCICGTGSNQLLDIGVTREWDGAVLLCKGCVVHFGRKFGWTVSADEYVEMANLVGTLTKEQQVLRDVMTGMTDDINAVVESFNSRISAAVGNSDDPVPDETDSPGTDETSSDFGWAIDDADEPASV